MKKINAYFKDYNAFHRTKGNKASHAIGIPLIILGLFSLLQKINFTISPALILWIVGCVFYLKLHLKLGITMVFSTAVLYLLGTLLSTPVAWTLFVLGWVAQGVGHVVYEKKSPAFLNNLTHLLIGPAYIQNHFLKIYKYQR